MGDPVIARHVPDDERRHRLARRHGLSPAHRAPSPLAATEAMGVLHATEPSTVYLSAWARVADVTVADIDRALYEERTLVKQLAMRRTLFVFPRDLLPYAWGSAARRVAGTEARKVAKDLVAAGVTIDPEGWLADAEEAIRSVLADGPLSARDIRQACPAVDVRVDPAPGTAWGGAVAVAPRILTLMGAKDVLVRATNGGHWRTSRPEWTHVEDWLGTPAEHLPAEVGYAELVRRWLAAFGPGTEADIAWWLGATKTVVRRALADVDAVAVSLDGGATGWLLPDDQEPEPRPRPWAALLPTLDPTTMGWKERDFYIDPALVPLLFDRMGNAGTTAWSDGRIVGCWVQDDDARVRVVLSAEVSAAARRRLDGEAERLTEWLDGVVIANVYKSQQMKHARLG